MNIGLQQIDPFKGFPNLALMKISAYYKSRGDCVEWYNPFARRYDIVYVSKVFSFSKETGEAYNADKVIKGGSGYDIQVSDGREVFRKRQTDLPKEIEHVFPDYSLYGIKDTAYGFLTRGCPRRCEFCIVKDKEGVVSYKVADVEEFWNGQKNIEFLDPNFFACKDWEELSEQIIRTRANINFNQGIDLRMLTESKCEAIAKMKIKTLHCAFDRYQDKDVILQKMSLLRKYYKGSVMVYVLCNYDTTIEQDLDRVYLLRDLKCDPYVMLYQKENADILHRRMQRWCNNKIIFKSCKSFEDYR